MDTLRFLDILGFVLGLIYLYLEYRASIWLWLTSIVMPAVDMVLYYRAGLYADFGLAIYYCLAALYGWAVWQWGHTGTEEREIPITHFKASLVLPVSVVFLFV